MIREKVGKLLALADFLEVEKRTVAISETLLTKNQESYGLLNVEFILD